MVIFLKAIEMLKSTIKIKYWIILEVFFSNIMSEYIHPQNQLTLLIVY